MTDQKTLSALRDYYLMMGNRAMYRKLNKELAESRGDK